jgi:hypothetical protein
LPAIRGQPQVGLCRLSSRTASINSWAGPFAPGRRPRLDANSKRYFRFVSR